jgi:hypothetical protein
VRKLASGYSIGAANNTEFATIAYDASSGSKIWLRRYGGPGDNGAAGASFVAVSPDGSKVFVTGSDAGATSDGDYATVAYSTSTGTRLWLSHYNGPATLSPPASFRTGWWGRSFSRTVT